MRGTKAIQQQSNKIVIKICIYNLQGYKKYFKLFPLMIGVFRSQLVVA